MSSYDEELIFNNEKLVHYVLSKMLHIEQGDQNYDDYYQEGMLALCRATQTYDSNKGKFSSYAISYIYGYIRTYISKQSLVKFNRPHIEKFNKIYKYMIDNPDEDIKSVCSKFNMKYIDYINTNYRNFISLDSPYDNDDFSVLRIENIVGDDGNELNSYNYYEIVDIVRQGLDKIKFSNKRHENIFRDYITDIINEDQKKQKYYADKYNISKESVSRIISRYTEQLKSILYDVIY